MLQSSIFLLIFLYKGASGQSPSYLPTDPTVQCPEGWYQYGDKCFKGGGKHYNSYVTMDVARDRCVDMGGDLASTHSTEEYEFLITFPINEIGYSIYIGLNDKEKSGQHVWTDGSPFDFSNWDANEPTLTIGNHKENCVEIIFDPALPLRLGKWNDLPCSRKYPYLCEIPTDPSLSNPNPKYCLDSEGGGYKLRSSCFHYVSTPKSWLAAEEFCQTRYDGHLVTVKDYTVHIFLNYIMKEMKVFTSSWIGLIPTKKKGLYYWSSGWYVVYERWVDGFSKNQLRDGACVTRLRNGYWDVRPCQQKYGFICEVSTIKPPELTPSIEGSYCPTDSAIWKDLGGDYCYYFNPEVGLSGREAHYECLRNGGTLTSIHSREESESIQQFIRYQGRTHYFIGVIRNINNRFVWEDGSRMSFVFWQEGQPDKGNEVCGVLREDTMEWHDYPCDYRDCGRICSVKKIPPNVTWSEENIICSGELFIIE